MWLEDDCHVYDPVVGTWDKIGDLPGGGRWINILSMLSCIKLVWLKVIYHRFHPALCTVNEGSSHEQLWITGGNQHRTSSKAIDIYDGQSMSSHNIELPIGLYQHNIVQIKAGTVLVMGGMVGNSQNVVKNYDIFVVNTPNCKLFICYVIMQHVNMDLVSQNLLSMWIEIVFSFS